MSSGLCSSVSLWQLSLREWLPGCCFFFSEQPLELFNSAFGVYRRFFMKLKLYMTISSNYMLASHRWLAKHNKNMLRYSLM